MRDFEGSALIETSADRLFNYLADVRHLPDYFPRVMSTKPGDGEDLTIVFDLDGDTHEAEAWFRHDPAYRRLQWGVPESGYQGWLVVAPDTGGARLVVSVQVPLGEYPPVYTEYEFATNARVDHEVRDTIESIRRIMRRTN